MRCHMWRFKCVNINMNLHFYKVTTLVSTTLISFERCLLLLWRDLTWENYTIFFRNFRSCSLSLQLFQTREKKCEWNSILLCKPQKFPSLFCFSVRIQPSVTHLTQPCTKKHAHKDCLSTNKRLMWISFCSPSFFLFCECLLFAMCFN